MDHRFADLLGIFYCGVCSAKITPYLCDYVIGAVNHPAVSDGDRFFVMGGFRFLGDDDLVIFIVDFFILHLFCQVGENENQFDVRTVLSATSSNSPIFPISHIIPV